MEIDIATIEPIIRAIRPMVLPQFGTISFEKKDDEWGSPLTKLDTQVETYLKTELAKQYPDIKFVGEETGGNRTAKRKWLCDPIDGTSLFIRGLPDCTTMLAYIEDEEVQFSVIYNFVTDDLYWAGRGKGAFKNGEPIKVSNVAQTAAISSGRHILKKQKINKDS